MPEQWIRVAATSEVLRGQVIGRTALGQPIALFHLDNGDFVATARICTHEYADLSEGWLEGGVIECPLHAGQFDVRTGRALCAPATEDLKVFPVRVADGELFVCVPTEEQG